VRERFGGDQPHAALLFAVVAIRVTNELADGRDAAAALSSRAALASDLGRRSGAGLDDLEHSAVADSVAVANDHGGALGKNYMKMTFNIKASSPTL
jgi:hypothetical protein